MVVVVVVVVVVVGCGCGCGCCCCCCLVLLADPQVSESFVRMSPRMFPPRVFSQAIPYTRMV